MDISYREQTGMGKQFLKNQSGAAMVGFAIMLTMLLGLAGLALDYGNLTVVRARMQNAVDAAVCGGGLKLPNQDDANKQADYFITKNGFTPVAGQPKFDPTNTNVISYTMSQNVPTYFMGLLGHPTVKVSATATAKMQPAGGGGPSGPFKYALFSINDLSISGNKNIDGSVHTNNNLSWSGNKTVSGSVEGKTISISGNSTIDSAIARNLNDITISGNYNNDIQKSGGVDTNIAMPDYSQQVNDAAAASNHTYSDTNKTYTGNINVDGSVYNEGSLTISGNFNSSGAMMSTGNIIISGNTNINGANQVCLYSKNGDITVSGNFNTDTNASSIIYAPKGTVTISGNQDFNGSIIAKRIVISGNLTLKGGNIPITSIPGLASKPHVKLIK
ncbi:MAG: pilus assembly protein TadG-related protein [Desulfobaccales bacterium]